jgi:hypothetical protein
MFAQAQHNVSYWPRPLPYCEDVRVVTQLAVPQRADDRNIQGLPVPGPSIRRTPAPAPQQPQTRSRVPSLQIHQRTVPGGVNCAGHKAIMEELQTLKAMLKSGEGSNGDTEAILARIGELMDKAGELRPSEALRELLAQVIAEKLGQTPPGTLPEDWDARITGLEQALTELSTKLDNGTVSQKLDQILEKLEEGGQHVELTLTVQSTANLPASYVDTSTLWAIQRATGISHVVLVINSDDPEWERLEPVYESARDKWPAMQLIDVVAANVKISPTPQLVIYYTAEGKAPEVLSGDRDVAQKLRELYTN